MRLEKLIHTLLKTEPFYGHFILNSQVRYDKRQLSAEEAAKARGYVPTAAAGVQNGAPILIFNVPFMDSHSHEQQVSILKHEILHLLLDHHGSSYYDKLNLQLWNIAMDCAINQFIDDLPASAITVDSLETICKKKLASFESSVYYYNQMLQHANLKTIKIPQTLDEHGAVEESALDKQIKKGSIAKAADASVKASAGQLPNGLQKVLEGLREKPLVNWKRELRNFVASAISSKTKHTRKKSHRRFELEQPGKKKKRELKLAVCVDSSGSVNDKQFESFISEICHISKNCAEANLIYADREVQKIVNLKNGKQPPNERYGNGGTAYQPAISKAMELGCNAIAYFGDMDSADVPKNPGVPVLWVTVGSTQRPGEFGRILLLELKK